MTIEFNEYGFTGENLSRCVVVHVEDVLQDKTIYIEFKKPSGKKLVSDSLVLNEGTCSYYLGSDLLDEEGNLDMQLVARTDSFTEKSKIYKYYISKSINATEELVQNTPSILDNLGIIITNGDGTKYLSDDGTYKTVSSGVVDYNNLENQPITIITNMDRNNPVNLRSLDSGLYRFLGYFKPYETYEGRFTVPSPLFVSIYRQSSKTSMQMYFAYQNQVQYYEMTDEEYTTKNAKLSQMIDDIADLETRVAALENK